MSDSRCYPMQESRRNRNRTASKKNERDEKKEKKEGKSEYNSGLSIQLILSGRYLDFRCDRSIRELGVGHCRGPPTPALPCSNLPGCWRPRRGSCCRAGTRRSLVLQPSARSRFYLPMCIYVFPPLYRVSYATGTSRNCGTQWQIEKNFVKKNVSDDIT